MIDWNKHKSAAYAAVTLFDEAGKSVGFKRLDRPTQTKTVADAVEQDGVKWTHIDTDGEPCKILIDAPDSLGRVIILRGNGWYMPVDRANLKPIKPTISKAEAWDMIESVNGSPDYIKEQYDII